MKVLICSAVVILPLLVNAQSKTNLSSAFEVNYGAKAWNQRATRIDSAFAYIKDKKSGKTVKVILSETEPDSSVFSGKFSVDWGDQKGVDPEVYIPPEKLRGNAEAQQNFNALLRKNKIKRKPLLFKSNANGMRVLDVYDTKEQVLDAAKVYKQELSARKQAKSLTKPIADESSIAMAKEVERKARLNQAKLDAANRERDRLRKQQLEKQKIEAMQAAQKKLAAAEQQRRKQRALETSRQAIQAYMKGDFKKAEKLFKKSSELDPENSSYYFKYGVALYKNEKYDEALVKLKLAKTTGAEDLERQYYMGLTHFRLKEYDTALERFTYCRQQKHPIISPSAAFYAGLIQFTLEKYKPAKESFEYVLDTSKDPKMDEKAESFIEQIANILRFKKMQDQRNQLNATVGLTYDSNVLQASINAIDQGSPSGASARLMFSGGYNYRAIYTPKKEFTAKVSTLTMYSFDENARIADPSLTNLNLPYVYKGKAFNKGYKLTVEPGYETLFMDLESSGVQANILNGTILRMDNTFIMNTNWFASYELTFRQDDSLIGVTDEAENADATNIRLTTTQSYFLDKSKKTGIISKFTYISNQAVGANRTFNRTELGSTYMAPLAKYDATWMAGLTMFGLQFPGSGRSDTNFTLNGSIAKPYNENSSAAVTATYTLNNSNQDTFQYNKWSVMATYSYNYNF